MRLPILNMIETFFTQDLRRVAQRFEGPVLCVVAITYLVLLEIHHIKPQVFAQFLDMEWTIPSLIAGFFASLAWYLLAEREEWSASYKRWGAAAICGFIFSLRVMGDEKHTYFFFLLPAAVLMLSCLPFLKDSAGEKLDKEHCNLNTTLVVQIFFAALSASILMLGISGIVASLGMLFEFEVAGRFYADTAVFCFIIFAPVFLLSQLPMLTRSAEVQHYPYPRGLRFIVNWIICPLVLTNLPILYAYIGKVLILGEWKGGYLSQMICGFGAEGTIAYLLAYPLAQEKKLLPMLVCRYFFKALLVPVLLLVAIVYLRIDAYGFTMPRYGLALIAFWLLCLSLYMGFYRAPAIKNMLLLLCALGILASVGPWSAYTVSVKSQEKRLYALLEEAGQLSNHKLKKISNLPSLTLRYQISSQITYLRRYRGEEVLSKLAGEDLPKIDYYDFDRDYTQKYLGWDYVSEYDLQSQEKKDANNNSSPIPQAINPRRDFRNDTSPFALNHNSLIPVKGCDYLLSMDLSRERSSDELVYFLKEHSPYEGTDFEVRLYRQSIAFGFTGGVYTEVPMAKLLATLEKQYEAGPLETVFAEMKLDAQGRDLGIRIAFSHISGSVNDKKQLEAEDVGFTACIQEFRKPPKPARIEKNKTPPHNVEIQKEMILIQ